MVAAGVSNDMIQVAKDTAPQWDREESEALPQDEDADHSEGNDN
jgi:acetolactate synthase-1/2/3 large subunit